MAAVATQPPAANGHAINGDSDMQSAPVTGSLRFSTGLILPPPEIKSVIDRTATFVARSANPPQFEEKIREGQRADPKFSFLNPLDPYHAYYRHKVERVTAGETEEETSAQKASGEETEAKQPVDVGVEPPTPEFILELPNISGIDLDIMKLTALFTARRGRGFLAALSEKEGRNYQFDFLRPTHSLFGYFNQLVDQYNKVLHPDKERLDQLKGRLAEGARWTMLEQGRKHGVWERTRREREKKRQDDQEAERIAFAEIDWHDYAIVQTIEFTAADANAELPPPMSVQEVESMTLAQKRMAAMIMENTAEDIEAHKARQAAAEAEAAKAVGTVGASQDEDGDAAMEESDDEDDAAKQEEARQREIARAQAMQAMPSTAGPMKIRTDYVPKLGANKGKTATTTCSICGQQIPVDELQEHMRIELLDPKWKEQRDALEARKAQASELQRGANVVSSLKNLARTRVDIFGTETDEERRKREEEEERLRRREREKVVWDGHTASKANTLDKFSTNVNFDEQIAAIHRAKGLGPQDANAIGPGIGPAAVPPPLTAVASGSASIPAPPQPAAASGAFAAATVSSGPQPASAYTPAPVMLPPLRYQGLNPPQPYGYQAPGVMPGMPGYGVPVQAGMVRSAEEMEASDMPPAKRQRVAKLPGGALYPEEDWIAMHPHPISLRVQLPNEPSKPEWKLDGSTITLPELPLNLLVSTLRDRILLHTGSSISMSRFRLTYEGKLLTNSSTIAAYNLEDEDLIVMSLKEVTKKK
ncbi:pre-mRNA splicing factor [Coprinopsis cinerea okayama7|uniref:Pre-mRNA splicing factor n=1 Tax=Coprinopsis cinerea (strain Okayama-7 / 130 / ATCC MYA-4618 / FGSC 9003) TaxID=240176 RepID=A8NGV8_COPC7|nr:pre-mRNA splicing factor [Coprinopsis cinerea okayama7\|eukprot:XP_001833612.1 pre-mRNA splicing factor [Coprinopsis cinerea okayama7\